MSPDAETRSAVMVPAASLSGDIPLLSACAVYAFEACVR